MPKSDFKNIIIRMPNWIGDLVMATPILADLRRAYPHAKITAMALQPICELLQRDPHIDELFCFTRPSPFSRRSDERNIIEKLRRGKYDLGVLLTNSFSSAWWFWQGKVTRRLGYRAHWRRLLLTDSIPFPAEVAAQHLVETYKMLLRPLGVPTSETLPKIYLGDEEVAQARALIMGYGIPAGHPLIGINPGAAYGSAKCWLPERFQAVAMRLLAETDGSILFFGDRMGTPLVKEICQGLPERAYNLAGATSLRELAALIGLCDLLLTNDSGPMHIAAALGTEVIALFGSTDPIVTGPYRSGQVLDKKVSCSPCFKRQCPIDFRCMKEITEEEVCAAILHKLQARGRRSC